MTNIPNAVDCKVVIVKDDWTYLITSEKNLVKKNFHHGVSCISEEAFNVTYNYVNIPRVKSNIEVLMSTKSKNTILYWEIDYRSDIINTILQNNPKLNLNKSEISNSLSALGL